DGTFEIQIDYLSSPDLDEKTLILCDPMLATGQSLALAYDSNLRPPGYEPDELPTALPRDIGLQR
ncbi:MAG: hypothetical protein IJL22_05050, partial [Bacteroidales bacterium]|nr:hypothetical protein [Bacteroidales bacterium]